MGEGGLEELEMSEKAIGAKRGRSAGAVIIPLLVCAVAAVAMVSVEVSGTVAECCCVAKG